MGSDHQQRGESGGRADKAPSATSKSARIRKAPAVVAFGAQGELALKLRAMGDELDDVVTGLRNRDALAIGSARKLVSSWRAIGEPILWYPTEIRSAGKLVLAAELERAGFVLPAYQAGLRALLPTEHTCADDLVALGEQLLRLQDGELSHEAFFMWLWSGNPGGIQILLGHPLAAMAAMVLEQPVPAEEIWQSHTAAAVDEWNQLAWSAAQHLPASALDARYRAPALALMQRATQGELGLSPGEASALRDACEGGPDSAGAQLALLGERPELAALLPPSDAASMVRSAIAARFKLAQLLQCIGMMSEPAAAAAMAAEPRLIQHAPRLCHELLAGKNVRSSLLLRALLAHGAAGARALCQALAAGELREVEGDLLSIVLGACVDLGHGAELLVPLWARREASVTARALALQAIGRDSTLFHQALVATPLTIDDAPDLHSLAAALRGSMA